MAKVYPDKSRISRAKSLPTVGSVYLVHGRASLRIDKPRPGAWRGAMEPYDAVFGRNVVLPISVFCDDRTYGFKALASRLFRSKCPGGLYDQSFVVRSAIFHTASVLPSLHHV